MERFYINLEIMRISLSLGEVILGVISQNQYPVKEVFESFIKIRDDYTHANKDDHEIANITIKHDEADIELDNIQICIFFETLLKNIARDLNIVNT